MEDSFKPLIYTGEQSQMFYLHRTEWIAELPVSLEETNQIFEECKRNPNKIAFVYFGFRPKDFIVENFAHVFTPPTQLFSDNGEGTVEDLWNFINEIQDNRPVLDDFPVTATSWGVYRLTA